MQPVLRGVAIAVATATLMSVSVAEFTVVRMHPPGALRSVILGVDENQQVGWSLWTGFDSEAALWEGSPGSWRSLHPRGADWSIANGVDDGKQVGVVSYTVGPNTEEIAALWEGSTNYLALGGDPSHATSIRNGIVTAILPSAFPQPGAGYWTAPTYSFTQLGTSSAEAHGTDGVVIVGWSYPQGATMWFADGRPSVALMPGQIASWAYGVYEGTQVGKVGYKAALWHGTPESYVDLGPIGANDAAAVANHRGIQVGWVIPPGQHWRASLWKGSAASRVDLHALLPSLFETSQARSVWVDDYDNVYIGGWGDNGPHFEALMWVSDTLNTQSFAPIRGIILSGGITSLKLSDDDRLVVRPGITFGTGEDPVQIEVNGFAPIPLPSNLTFWVESHASASNVRQTIQLYNFRTNAYEQLALHTLTQIDSVRAVATISDAGRFIEAGTRRVKAKLTYKPLGPIFAFPWEVRIDRTWWTLRG